uniref:Uncharacterized protein n=1 Tax=Euplotes harpa TaxID=151035 RepID=A0A7S3N3G6_9SPIT|mmetsp:Transcript_16938/g.19564  ORF Transcript_16938/g.19564 Transcript_16938/m.19564 type:complete len:105 (+) Transcript_16938:2-316(+)
MNSITLTKKESSPYRRLSGGRTVIFMQSDEDKAQTKKGMCPKAPMLKPRNQCFKFNSAKNFVLENLAEYTPFFYSEGEESSDGDFTESTQDIVNNCEERKMTDD